MFPCFLFQFRWQSLISMCLWGWFVSGFWSWSNLTWDNVYWRDWDLCRPHLALCRHYLCRPESSALFLTADLDWPWLARLWCKTRVCSNHFLKHLIAIIDCHPMHKTYHLFVFVTFSFFPRLLAKMSASNTDLLRRVEYLQFNQVFLQKSKSWIHIPAFTSRKSMYY